jgi:NTP pyrophosphatase (non-canonical NTP hydrolase)
MKSNIPPPILPPKEKMGNQGIRFEILESIKSERLRHMKMKRDVLLHDLQWLMVETEELGEVARALNEKRGDSEEIDRELIQLAAAVVAHLEMREIRRRHPNVADMVDTKTTYCGACDGVGWTEGGPTIKTTCKDCKGTGQVKA